MEMIDNKKLKQIAEEVETKFKNVFESVK